MEFNATLIVSFISFVVFVFIMNWILYKPIGDIVDKRKKFIDENYNEAKNNSNESKIILKEREDKLNSTRKEAQKLFSNAIDKAKNTKEKSILLAEKKLSEDIEEKTNKLNEQSTKAKEMLRQDIVNLAYIISDKFINSSEEIEPELIDKMINR